MTSKAGWSIAMGLLLWLGGCSSPSVITVQARAPVDARGPESDVEFASAADAGSEAAFAPDLSFGAAPLPICEPEETDARSTGLARRSQIAWTGERFAVLCRERLGGQSTVRVRYVGEGQLLGRAIEVGRALEITSEALIWNPHRERLVVLWADRDARLHWRELDGSRALAAVHVLTDVPRIRGLSVILDEGGYVVTWVREATGQGGDVVYTARLAEPATLVNPPLPLTLGKSHGTYLRLAGVASHGSGYGLAWSEARKASEPTSIYANWIPAVGQPVEVDRAVGARATVVAPDGEPSMGIGVWGGGRPLRVFELAVDGIVSARATISGDVEHPLLHRLEGAELALLSVDRTGLDEHKALYYSRADFGAGLVRTRLRLNPANKDRTLAQHSIARRGRTGRFGATWIEGRFDQPRTMYFAEVGE